jgi:DNA-directed RNA polymerase specialized sigma24 family protein
MSEHGEVGWPDTAEPVLPDVDAHLAHVFDYCRALMGRDGEAARTARSLLVTAHALQPDPDRLRPWLFAQARRHALALRPPGADEPPYLPAAQVAALSRQTDSSILRAFRALTDGDREVLDLVYRHGIRPADLPDVLDIPTAEAYRRLAVAEEEFISLAPEPSGGAGGLHGSADAALDGIADLPLAPLPASAEHRQRSRGKRRRHRRPTQLVAAAVLPAAAVAALVMYLTRPDQPVGSHSAAVVPGADPRLPVQLAGPPSPAATPQPTSNATPSNPGYVFVPVASPSPTLVWTTAPSPSLTPEPPPTSSSVLPSTSDTPTPTQTPTLTPTPTPTTTTPSGSPSVSPPVSPT